MSAAITLPKRPLTWLITGCSSGFGLSLTRCVQAGGHTVIATSRDPSRTPELVTEVEENGGKWIKLDVNEPDSGAVIDDLEKSGVEIDVLVNNAGYVTIAPVESSTEDEMRAQMETMYFAPLRLIQAVLPHMRKRRFGTIVNHSSGAALDGNPGMGPYAGAKAGLDGLTKVLAKEVAPLNIRCLTVVLGTYNTSFGDGAIPAKNVLPDHYNGSVVDKMLQAFAAGTVPANGDKDKAMKAVWEVVSGEGAGAGHEGETLLPLGTDMVDRMTRVKGQFEHALHVFGKVAESVALEK